MKVTNWCKKNPRKWQEVCLVLNDNLSSIKFSPITKRPYFEIQKDNDSRMRIYLDESDITILLEDLQKLKK
jgi:hypothetical protein